MLRHGHYAADGVAGGFAHGCAAPCRVLDIVIVEGKVVDGHAYALELRRLW
ncbi:hypothetical protein [Janthinobacterium sp. GW458P]|uniref:hypothetical protein n=1 Tax=Janthinobacterium sp. GW458P TaxID=1981504 RepID=UPI001551874F|nr:hypothetical protein [Janthinobacterium sp. GW458P]MBE3024734.1 hypothetical protein [Janthinobacterium sp. GW458P]